MDSVLDLPHKLNDTELVVKPYFDFLQPAQSSASEVFNDETQDVMESSEDLNNIQMETSPILVKSSPLLVHSFSAEVTNSGQSSSQTELEVVGDSEEEEAVEVMEDQTEKEEIFSCHVAITDPVKLALFQSNTFLLDLQKASPNSSIQNKNDGVYIEGSNKLQLDQLKDKITDFIGSMVETNFTLELEKAQFLDRKDVKEHLLRTINQTESSFLYTVSDSTISVTSLSQNTANQACSFLKSQVCCFSMPVEMEQECILDLREWSEFLQSLGFTSVKVSEQGGNIDVWTLKGMEDEKQAAIMVFLTTPIERDTVISMEPGMLKYMQTHCHQLLADMDQVSIFPLEGEGACGLKVSNLHFCILVLLIKILYGKPHNFKPLIGLDPWPCSCLPNGRGGVTRGGRFCLHSNHQNQRSRSGSVFR